MKTLTLALVIATGLAFGSEPGGDPSPHSKPKPAATSDARQPSVFAARKNPPTTKTAGTTSPATAEKKTTPRAPVCRPCRPAYLFM